MTITAVAKRCGVTHGTVSRLINQREGVAEETAERIRAAMKELNYRPPPLNRRRGRKPAPAGVRTGNICLLMLGTSQSFLERPGVHATVTSVEKVLRRRGLSMLLAMAANLRDVPPAIIKRKADGLLIVGEASDTLPAVYRSLPSVWLLSSHTRLHTWADHVSPDNDAVGLVAAEYLIKHGHRLAAFMNDQPKHPGFEERGWSFERHAKARGLEVQMYISKPNAHQEAAGAEDPWGLAYGSQQVHLADQLLNVNPRPTGLFVPTDEQTLRLYPLLKERGLRLGEDVEVVSCDNQDFWLHQLEPRPVSIDLNFEMIGRRAVEQLLLRISHPEQPSGTRILIPAQLDEPEG